MGKRWFKIALSMVVSLQLLSPVSVLAENPQDVIGHWAEEKISQWTKNGSIQGYDDGSFKPDQPVTRAEFVTFLNRSLKIDELERNPGFADVNQDQWFYGEVAAAKGAGYILGYPDGTFGPNRLVTRQEVAVIINHLLEMRGAAPTKSKTYAFTDEGDIAGWSRGAVIEVSGHAVMEGYSDGTFRSENPITRAEAVVTIDRLSGIASAEVNGISGQVVLDGQPVPNAMVRLMKDKGKEAIADTLSDAQGFYRFPLSEEGAYDLTAQNDQSIGFFSGLEFKNQSVQQPISLVKGVKVDGTIVDSQDKAFGGRPIYFTTNPTFQTQTDESGRFSLLLLPNRTYSISSLVPGKENNGLTEIASGQKVGDKDGSLGRIRTTFSTITPPVQSSGSSSGSSQTKDTIAPVIRITSPSEEATYVTNEQTVTLAGTASDNVSVVSVTYSTNDGPSSAVNGTPNWEIPNLILIEGENRISVSAVDAEGNKASDQIIIQYQPERPFVVIQQPTTEVNYTTEAKTVTLSGTVRTSVTSVTYSVYQGGVTWEGITTELLEESGSFYWHITGLPMLAGENKVIVFASDGHGLKGTANITIVRTVSDKDSDGLPDVEERTIETDPLNPDTDGDGLIDGAEVLLYRTNPLLQDTDGDGLRDAVEVDALLNPLAKDTDMNGTDDGHEDADLDQLTNLEEQTQGTDLRNSDTDGDGVSDGDEVKVHHTNPLKADTDEDGLVDSSEVLLGFDPLKVDTDGDGLIDSKETIDQTINASKFSNVVSSDSGIVPSLVIKGAGDINRVISISDASSNPLLSGNNAVIGNVMDVHMNQPFESAQISFEVKGEVLTNNALEDLNIAWFKEDGTVVPLPTTIDPVTKKLTTEVSHFSMYGVINLATLAMNWELMTESSTVEKGQADIVFVLDSTGSMGSSINNVKTNIVNFVNTLEEDKVDARLGLVDYKDIDADGPESTKKIGWFTNPEEFKNKVNEIRVVGGGDGPESAVDALEESRIMGYRNSVSKFVVLLTDADYHMNTRFESVQNMDEEIALLKKDGINVSVIGNRTYKISYEKLFTETNGLWANIYDSFSENLNLLKEKITTRTNDGVWIRLNNGKVTKLLKAPDLTDTETDSDQDGVVDSRELLKEEELVLDPEVKAKLSSRFPGEVFPDVVKLWATRSDPGQKDTDGDGDNDNVDDLPKIAYKPATILIHGINSDTGSAFGLDTLIDNHYPGVTKASEEVFKEIYNYTGTGKHDYSVYDPKEEGILKGYSSLTKGESYKYSDLNTQFIRNVKQGEMGQYLVDKGMLPNSNLFVFNWEANGHVDRAAFDLYGYLKNLAAELKKAEDFADTTKRDESGEQIVHFNLVGHSAGGLISRYVIENLNKSSETSKLFQIGKLTTIDTPHFGSDYMSNSGDGGNPIVPCNVLTDLDADDSYLLFSNNKYCPSSEKEEKVHQPFNLEKPESTDYYYIAGFRIHGPEKPHIVEMKLDQIYNTEKHVKMPLTDLVMQVKADLKANDIKYDWNSPNDTLGDGDYDVSEELDSWGGAGIGEVALGYYRYGDSVVSLSSQLGLPGYTQVVEGDAVAVLSKEAAGYKFRYVELDPIFDNEYEVTLKVIKPKRAFVFVAEKDGKDVAEHTHIEHQPEIFDLVYDIITE
ncbi:S-layer homology domain-containing protein [Bacillus sp. 3255]|uniref:S-layer homology domain-containing protein n=1 Tax=Bacillus sp. 3255 TaxID=2817904 RepID=UPI00285A86D8|nr:S-layer homology domain-containing protein [Bacillus sp. 3255]MDR6884330.1 hypothetical protein [Bacillus sp. 3255]